MTAAPAITLRLGGRKWELRPTAGALERIEQHLGAGLGALLERYLQRAYGLTDTARIVREGLAAAHGHEAPSHEQVVAWLLEDGIDTGAFAAVEMLDAALQGFAKFAEQTPLEEGKDDEPDPRQAPATATASPGATSSAPPS